MENYADVKNLIKARLYNTNEDINALKRNADIYGFDGLVIVPVIEFGETFEGVSASAKVTKELIQLWGVTEDEVFAKAIENLDYVIKPMIQVLRETMGDMPEDILNEILPPMEDDRMYVVSNRNMLYGASAIIPATKELLERFPNGFVVLPSSKHEVLVVPKRDDVSSVDLNDIVNQVNAGVVSEKDYLSDDVYEFVA